MTRLSIRSEHLVAQLMAPMSRLLNDVNQVLNTEIAEAVLNEDAPISDIQTMNEQEFVARPGKTASVPQHAIGSSKDEVQHGQNVSATGGLNKRRQTKLSPVQPHENAGVPGSPAISPTSRASNKGISATRQTQDQHHEHAGAPKHASLSSSSPANNGMPAPIPGHGQADLMNKDVADNTILLKKQTPSTTQQITTHGSPQEQSPVIPPMQEQTQQGAEKTVQSIISPAHSNAAPSLNMKSVQAQVNSSLDTAGMDQTQVTASQHELSNQIQPEAVAPLTHIPLRRRTTGAVTGVDDVAAVTSPDVRAAMLLDEANGLDEPMSQAAIAPRAVRGQSRRIIQGIDPVLERAHQVSDEAMSQELLNDDQDMSVNRVQNTFNVNVSMNQDGGSTSTDQMLLQDTLLEMLRTAARRQGLEV